MQPMRGRALAAVLVLAVGVGCSSGGDNAAGSARAQIGPAGGALTSRDGRLTVTIPAGAVARPVVVTIAEETAPAGALGSAYALTPEGPTFSRMVTLSIHYDDGSLGGHSPEELRVASWADGVRHPVPSTLTLATRTVSASVAHFSEWALFLSGSGEGDAGSGDGGAPQADAAVDAPAPDGGPLDGSPDDGAVTDAGDGAVTDAGDGAMVDAGARDVGSGDAADGSDAPSDVGGGAGAPDGGGALYALTGVYDAVRAQYIFDTTDDGIPDLLGVGATGDISVWKGHGDGTFDTTPIVTSAGLSVGPVTGDFDGDSRTEFASIPYAFSTSSSSVSITLARARGDGTFATTTSSLPLNPSTPVNYVLCGGAPFGPNGRSAIAVAGAHVYPRQTNQLVYALIGNSGFDSPVSPGGWSMTGEPALADQVNLGANGNAGGCWSLGDVDGDGNPDVIILANSQGLSGTATTISALAYGNGAGGLKSASGSIPGFDPTASPLAVRDLDGDKHPDVFWGSGATTRIVWGGDGTSTAAPWGELADYDGDGLTDIIANNSAGGYIALNDGQRHFDHTIAAPLAGLRSAGDLDRDGAADLLSSRAFVATQNAPTLTAVYLSTRKHAVTAPPDVHCGAAFTADQCAVPRSF